MRLRFSERNDLSDYADSVHWRMKELIPISFMEFKDANCVVLHREGLYQTELVTIPPETEVPSHAHPDVDSIDVMLSGEVKDFQVGNRFIHPIRNFGLSIPRNIYHGGKALEQGFVFVSYQKWLKEPSHIGLSWNSFHLPKNS